MIITDIRYHPYCVPFRHPFTTAHGTLTAREGVIVELVTDAGISGYGDMAAVTEFGAPDVATLLRAARDLQSSLMVMQLGEIQEQFAESVWGRGLFAQTAKPVMFAIETALYPLLRYPNYPAIDEDRPVRVNAVVGAIRQEEAVSAAKEAVANGFGCVKLKVGMLDTLDQELERIFAVREAIGYSTHLRLDANEAWSYDAALFVAYHIHQADIQFLEQPLERADIEGLQRLREAGGIQVAADESVTDYASARRDRNAADVFVLKPQLTGGQTITDRMIRHYWREKKIVVTTSLESGIGVAATVHIASYGGSRLLECGLATLSLLEDDLIQEEIVVKDGMMYPPLAPVTPDWDALARYRLNVEGL